MTRKFGLSYYQHIEVRVLPMMVPEVGALALLDKQPSLLDIVRGPSQPQRLPKAINKWELDV
jgi:hypothetical protein